MRISRRQLLLGGAATVGAHALGIGGCAPPREAAIQRSYESYDLCVVGSGFAGIHLALRAVQHGLKTIVIEAGHALAASFDYSTSGEVSYPIGAARQIGAGGTSGHWGGATSRMWPRNFRVPTQPGSRIDWPIRYEDLADYYCESEALLSVRGGVISRDGAQPPRSCPFPTELHPSYLDPDLEIDGRSLEFFVRPRSMRGKQPVRLADVEVPQFARHPLGTLVDGLRVTEVVTLDGESVSHLACRSRNGDPTDVFAKRFVIAAGVVESPRLLLASPSQWFPDGIGNAQGLVGRYFCHHPHFRGMCTAPSNAEPRDDNLRLRSHSLDESLLSRGMNAFNIQLDYGSPDGAVGISLSPDTEPVAENRLTLRSDRLDSLGLSVPNLNLSYSARDEETFGYAEGVGNQINVALGGEQSLDYERRIHSHPSGTCRMGGDASTGVVDANHKVFGVANLYVSGGSVFPLAGATNPTNTVVAMTLRLADHLVEQRLA